MKSTVLLFRRGDDHKIKKNQEAKPLRRYQLRFNIIRLNSEISSLTSKLEYIDTLNLHELSPNDQKLTNKYAVAQLKLAKFEREMSEVMERRAKAKAKAEAAAAAARKKGEEKGESWAWWMLKILGALAMGLGAAMFEVMEEERLRNEGRRDVRAQMCPCDAPKKP